MVSGKRFKQYVERIVGVGHLRKLAEFLFIEKENSYFCNHKRAIKNPDSSPASEYLGEERPGLRGKSTNKMEGSKQFFEKVFSTKRMERYFALYPDNEAKAIAHYECNLMLSESLYTSLSVMEVTLRNALCRELETMTGREDWYAIFPTTPGLRSLNRYITEASQHITARREQITPSKIVAELTLGFWVSLLNSEYERTLWQALRRAFPYMPRQERQRKNVSTPLNLFRRFRNRVFHNESICWNLDRVEEIHDEILKVIGWMNCDLPEWVKEQERFDEVCVEIRKRMGWK